MFNFFVGGKIPSLEPGCAPSQVEAGDTPCCHRPSRRGGLSPHPAGLWRLEDESLMSGAPAGQEDAPEPALSGTVAAAADDSSPRSCVSEATATRTPGKERRGHGKVCVGQLWRE